MPWPWGKNYQGQPDDGEEPPPESPDQAVDPQAAPTSDRGDQEPAVLPQPRHREQINLPPAPPQTEQHAHTSPPPARAQPKHREQINLPPAPPQAEQHGHVSPPPARGQQGPPKHREQINLPPTQAQAEQRDHVSPPPAHAQPEHRGQINLPPAQSVMPTPAQSPVRPEHRDQIAAFPAAGNTGQHSAGGACERPLYSGRERVRPAVALDGGTVGTWTVRGGWAVGSDQRPGQLRRQLRTVVPGLTVVHSHGSGRIRRPNRRCYGCRVRSFPAYRRRPRHARSAGKQPAGRTAEGVPAFTGDQSTGRFGADIRGNWHLPPGTASARAGDRRLGGIRPPRRRVDPGSQRHADPRARARPTRAESPGQPRRAGR